ncbi:hypothetical protein [Actinocatenispora rupis]|uniref:Uncharacterized protein n=1 Tax=Actinocatenispora rupis TaxID=519421 RepID=A0A8J3NE84_9ACTN|nr:hypothetical protein [Actinocatenispora rupis]GID13792.1 hypothetical protein Aru02nite_46810 [Actinocatenispora rupis]
MGLLSRWFARAGRRRPDVPARPSIERLAADLRRLSADLQSTVPRSAIRQRAVVWAYEQTLRDACDALSVAYELEGLGGLTRELECARMEAELQAAGLCTRHPAGRRR